MMKEILLHGPIACGINAMPILGYESGIVTHQPKDRSIDHIISVVGWGEDQSTGLKFWEVRNNWGEYWGEDGWFRVERGTNALLLKRLASGRNQKLGVILLVMQPAHGTKR